MTAYIPLYGLSEKERASRIEEYRARWSARDMRLYEPEWMDTNINGDDATITYDIRDQIQDDAGNWIQPPAMKALLVKEAGFWKVEDIVPKDVNR